jgi:hypothetical protein
LADSDSPHLGSERSNFSNRILGHPSKGSRLLSLESQYTGGKGFISKMKKSKIQLAREIITLLKQGMQRPQKAGSISSVTKGASSAKTPQARFGQA